jgi:hypothetical protein
MPQPIKSQFLKLKKKKVMDETETLRSTRQKTFEFFFINKKKTTQPSVEKMPNHFVVCSCCRKQNYSPPLTPLKDNFATLFN